MMIAGVAASQGAVSAANRIRSHGQTVFKAVGMGRCGELIDFQRMGKFWMSQAGTAVATLDMDMPTVSTSPTAHRSLLDLTLAELEREFVASGLSPTHAR